MTNDAALAQIDMLIAQAPIEDLRDLCRQQQARILELETQAAQLEWAAELNGATVREMQRAKTHG